MFEGVSGGSDININMYNNNNDNKQFGLKLIFSLPDIQQGVPWELGTKKCEQPAALGAWR